MYLKAARSSFYLKTLNVIVTFKTNYANTTYFCAGGNSPNKIGGGYIKRNTLQRFIFKIHTKRLKKAKWKLELTLQDAARNGELVALADSTVLRWIDEINGRTDIDARAAEINRRIRATLKSGDDLRAARKMVKQLIDQRTEILFKEDYICVVMDSDSDYRKIFREGFSVNGINFVRLLATTAGIKNNTVVFVSEKVHSELRRRLDNGRDLNKPIVPAKFGAYEALACSASTPVSDPRGVLVVPDCYTTFREDVITINDSSAGEPLLEYVDNYEVHKDCSDGFGTLTPERARIWSEELGLDYVFAGCNTRNSFEKGMLVVFDHVAFVEKYNGASPENESGYFVKDVWGDYQDVRKVDVILTDSMLKLWDSYSSAGDYLAKCKENHYSFSITKVTESKHEEWWSTNYQFLQDFDFTDDDIRELCQPTIDWLKDVLGGDYRKLMLYANGTHITDNTFLSGDNDCVKALMIEPNEVNDPYVGKKVRDMISKRIQKAKLGKIEVHGHFEIACGDPFALWQSICGQEVTGLLKAGEVYSKYWVDCGSEYISCFRAPMTSRANIKKLKVTHDADIDFWYQHINTMVIFNCWDTTMDAMNGEDCDGDMNFLTDNDVIVRNTNNTRTLFCMQSRADKRVVTQELLVESDINGFGNDIGKITNDITSQFDWICDYDKDSLEYKTLDYRIKCGQKFQQDSIDRAKGIITNPRPSYWFNFRDNATKDDDNYVTRRHKYINQRIAVDKKPYFMIYNYAHVRSKYSKFIKAAQINSEVNLGLPLKETISYSGDRSDVKDFAHYYRKMLPVSNGECVINRICRLFENEFATSKKKLPSTGFDYTVLMTDARCDFKTRSRLKELYAIYKDNLKRIMACKSDSPSSADKEEFMSQLEFLKLAFKDQCDAICPNKEMQTNALIEIAYGSNAEKNFTWDMCGNEIIENLLRSHSYTISYPVKVGDDEDYDFVYRGEKYAMCKSFIAR